MVGIQQALLSQHYIQPKIIDYTSTRVFFSIQVSTVADLNNDAGSMLVTGRPTMDHSNDCYSKNKYT